MADAFISSTCPRCGAPLHDRLMPTLECDHCGTPLRRADVDLADAVAPDDGVGWDGVNEAAPVDLDLRHMAAADPATVSAAVIGSLLPIALLPMVVLGAVGAVAALRWFVTTGDAAARSQVLVAAALGFGAVAWMVLHVRRALSDDG